MNKSKTKKPTPPKKPRAISPLPKGDEKNFETLTTAALNRDICLVASIRKADGKPVALVCAINYEDAGEFGLVPLAVMIEGNPFELFEDPASGGTPELPKKPAPPKVQPL